MLLGENESFSWAKCVNSYRGSRKLVYHVPARRLRQKRLLNTWHRSELKWLLICWIREVYFLQNQE